MSDSVDYEKKGGGGKEIEIKRWIRCAVINEITGNKMTPSRVIVVGEERWEGGAKMRGGIFPSL